MLASTVTCSISHQLPIPTLVNLIRNYTNLGLFIHTQKLHCHVLKSGYVSNAFVSTALINFYAKFELLREAQTLFDEIPEPTVVSWNTLISGYVHSGQSRKALNLFLQLERSDLRADSYSFTAALSACGQLSLLQLGKLVHGKIVKLGAGCSVVVSNCLIDMYGKCGSVEESTRVFHEMVDRDAISWNTIIAANMRNVRLEQAFRFFDYMPNPDTISYNELINGVAQFGKIEDAIDILSCMPYPNSSSWNSIITGYVNRGRAKEALKFFSKMHLEGVQMDQFTFSTILSGTASISANTWGSLIHCCTIKYGLDSSVVVGSALIDMYSKSGQLKEAEIMFGLIPKKNLVTWNALISGYAHNGDSGKVIELYEQLVKDSQPDEITFLSLLSACLHNKIPLKVANKYFDSLMKDYGINPTTEHCSSMIRLMGQEGDVCKAEEMIYEFGFKSYGVVWRALLGACVACGNIEVAETAAAKVMELEGDNEFVYVMMSNIYASHGKWRDVGEIRELMKERRVRKEAGLSWVES